MIAVCEQKYDDQSFSFTPIQNTDEYFGSRPVSELSDTIGIMLDMDKNGDVNLGWAEINLSNYVDSGELDQATSDMYFSIIENALFYKPENDYKGNNSVMLYDITEYLEETGIYFYDWRDGGKWNFME